MHARGRSENSVGHYRRADAALSRALEELASSNGAGDAPEVLNLRARIRITQAMSRFGIDGPDAGLSILADVQRMLEGDDHRTLRMIAHVQAGAINVMSSNWRAALDELSHVAPHLQDLAPRERCSALINRGLASVSLLDLEAGRLDLQQALDLALEHALAPQAFKARHNLGCVAYLAGDIPSALKLMAQAADMDAGVGMARAHLDHAKVLLDAGLIDEAEEVLNRALDAARHDHQPVERGDVQLDLSRAALLRGDLAEARSWAGRAVRTFRALHATDRVEEAELLGAAVDLGVGRSLARAARVASSWDTTAPVLPAERLATRIKAEVALARHDVTTAREELHRLDNSHPVALGVLLHEHLLAARVATAEGHRARATAILREAAERLASDQSSVHSLEVRAGLAFHASRIRDADVGAASDSGSPDEVFDSVERWRAASQRTPPLRPSDDAQTADLVGRLRRLRRESGDAPGHRQSEVATLQEAITARLRSVQGDRADKDLRPTVASEAQALAADRHATLVTFHEIRDAVVRLVVGRDGIRQSVLGSVADVSAASARASADARAAAVARPSMAAFLDRARTGSTRDVDGMLLSGVELEGTVVLVPTGGLAALPWRALPSLERHPVIAAPSVTAWARRRTSALAPVTVCALAGPGLPRSRDEARAVRTAWGRHTESPLATAMNGYAVSADVRTALASASIVHLAAHGHHVDQSPLFSSLDMGDGPVFAHELTAPLAAELVILSACDVGRSRGRVGDEPLGLAAALLSLGVQCVVAATNPVHDDVAAAAMSELHERLVAGTDVATALQQVAANVPGAEAFCAYGNTWSRP